MLAIHFYSLLNVYYFGAKEDCVLSIFCRRRSTFWRLISSVLNGLRSTLYLLIHDVSPTSNSWWSNSTLVALSGNSKQPRNCSVSGERCVALTTSASSCGKSGITMRVCFSRNDSKVFRSIMAVLTLTILTLNISFDLWSVHFLSKLRCLYLASHG